MNTLIFLIIFTLSTLIYIFFGLRTSKTVKTDSDYYVANRQLGIWQISSNLIATQLGGGMILGTAASAYNIGYYGILYTLGMALGFLLLSFGVAAKLQQFHVTTTAQLFETQYGSQGLKKIASLFSIFTLFGILIAQIVGFKSLMLSIGFGSLFIIIPFWLCIIGYTMLGGLRAISINDMIQLALITITFSGIFIYFLYTGITAHSNFLPSQALFKNEALTFNKVLSIIIMPALFALIEQDLAQRFFASRTKLTATSSAAIAALFLALFAFIPVYLGMKVKMLNIKLPAGANPLLIVLEQTFPDIVFSLALCAIIAAIISTADALMNGISANITQDFSFRFFNVKNSLITSKITTGLVGISALITSYFVPQNIIDLIISSYELSVSTLLIPLLFCYYKKNVKKYSALLAIIMGGTTFVFLKIVANDLPVALLALFSSLIGYLITEIYNKGHEQ